MATEQALRITRYSDEFAQNRVPNILGFNQDGRNYLFVVAVGSGTVAGLPGEFFAGNQSLQLNPGNPALDFEVNAGSATRTYATRGGRYMFVFAILIPSDYPTTGDVAYVKLFRNGAEWSTIMVTADLLSSDDIGHWVCFYKDYAPVPANSEFDWSFGVPANPLATSIAFDGIGMYFADDRDGLGFPPRYNPTYKSMPNAAELANGLYNIRKNPLRVNFEEVTE